MTSKIRINRDQFLEQGYLILRNVIPPDQLDALRTSYEVVLNRQRSIWTQERIQADPAGGIWESSPQPRLKLNATKKNISALIDDKTANTVELWLHENTCGASSHLMDVPDAAVTEMYLLCNPIRDHGPANWHRDIHPIDTAPLEGYIRDIEESGPSYVQWNIPLYDDDVLWVVPGSHLRLNTMEEDRQLLANDCIPLPDSVQTTLSAGDGVVYITPILHWGSNYSTKLRRTIHGGFARWNRTYYENLSFVQQLAPWARDIFERWTKGSSEMQDHTESTLRAAIARDEVGFSTGIQKLHPRAGESGRQLLSVFLCKAAGHIRCAKHPELEGIPTDLRRHGMHVHSTSLNWGPKFAERFTLADADELWHRFEKLDIMLQAENEQFSPGFQSEPMRYYFNKMPDEMDFKSFTTSWQE